MDTTQYFYWQEEDAFLGYRADYPEYWTQGTTLGDLEAHLRDLHQDLNSDELLKVDRE